MNKDVDIKKCGCKFEKYLAKPSKIQK